MSREEVDRRLELLNTIGSVASNGDDEEKLGDPSELITPSEPITVRLKSTSADKANNTSVSQRTRVRENPPETLAETEATKVPERYNTDRLIVAV
jgi:hypothetical protein